ncbi:hypothetical protein FQN51_004561 [Onygenales sp. PD_10]|nr:hypothetical protein FQN51_004561 [Onygenales sp. PD_10]
MKLLTIISLFAALAVATPAPNANEPEKRQFCGGPCVGGVQWCSDGTNIPC